MAEPVAAGGTTTPVVVITPWYPNETDAFAGAFVRQSVLGLRSLGREVLVVHLENVGPDDHRPPTRYRRDDVEVAWIGVPTEPLAPREQTTRNQRAALLAHLPPEVAAASEVHVHVGIPTGWAVADVVPQDARVVLTEHATYLTKVFRQEATREMYVHAMARADRVTAVSEHLARSLRRAVPEMADKVVALPNVMPLREVPYVEHPVGPLRHWLYVGRLVQQKGVERLLRAFALAAEGAGGDDLRLTVVGQGPQREELEASVARLGLSEQVHFAGAVPPDEVLGWMGRADVLVHLADVETFGLTMVEAVASGLPVVCTRSGGPQESLATAEVLDRVRTVGLGDDAQEVVAAVASLEAALAGSDPRGAREAVELRYDGHAVVRRLDALLRGEEPADDAHRTPFTVLGVSLDPMAERSLLASLDAVVEQGGRAVVITNRPEPFHVHGPAVAVIDLHPLERRFLPYAVERAVVKRAPIALLRTVRRVLLGVSRRTSGTPSAGLARGGQLVALASLRWGRFSRTRRPAVYARLYDQVSPWWLARVADASVLADLSLDDVDVMLTPDWRAQPFAWRLVRRSPLPTRRRITRLQVARARLEKDEASAPR